MIRRRLTHMPLSFAVFSALPTAALASAGLAYITGSLTPWPDLGLGRERERRQPAPARWRLLVGPLRWNQ